MNHNQHITLGLFDEANSIPVFRKLLKDKEAELQQRFDPHQSVAKLLRDKTVFIDKILSVCWQHFLGEQAIKLALCAIGGYGRKELFPYSDIDILALLPSDDSAAHESLVNFFTFLWDIGLKPGYSVRTVAQCIDIAKHDQSIMTSLMENRLIVGCVNLYKTLRLEITPDKIWPSDQFFAAKMEEKRLRYAKFHDTAYNLEPNIKEGPGGLRDRQVISWVFKRHYNSATLKELTKYGFLPESEYAELVDAVEVLWRIRYALHLLTKRAEDRLIFDYQRDLARQFGFKNENAKYNQDVEQFMQFYFKTVQGLERLNEMLLQLFQERFVNGEAIYSAQAFNEHFVTLNGYLEAMDDNVFERHPAALLEIFLILAQNPSLKGVRATTIRLIRKNLHLIDQAYYNNKAINALFITIFRQPNGITTQLRRMNRYGVLAAYLPCFANIVARMQYDLFHIYTVDEHTLFVIRNLRRFSLEKHRHELPFCNDIFLLIAKPEILYFAALFHDIAKGKNGDHSTLGGMIAKDFCLQHQLSSDDTKLIIWLVRNHLIMSMTAQRKDIGDPAVIYTFAQQVGSVKYLNHLYLLTVADIRATNPDLWNSWKDSLLKELYTSTHKALRKGGLADPIDVVDRMLENKKTAKEELMQLGLSEQAIEAAWQHTSEDYFLRYSTDEIIWHTQAIASYDEKDLPLVLLRTQTQRGSAEVFVYALDDGPIFSICTATLDQLGLSILDARIITTSDNYVLNSFQVLEQSGEPLNESFRENHICTVLRANLLSREVREGTNIHRLSRQAKHFPIPTQIQFHTDPLNHYTILELITTDYAGLLSRIGKAFIQEGINLHSAKITTIGSRAEDMFYITDQQLQPIEDLAKQTQIKATILQVLAIN